MYSMHIDLASKCLDIIGEQELTTISEFEQAPGDKKSGAVIIYIAGGVTLSEMRAVYEIAQTFKREIYIGSTHIITPRGFLEDLKSLHLKMLI
ncbi:syntaxin binding protein 1 [Coemansia sp. RSA 1843]|nr:syntaxin binding protein 1 [Coemansia sp. RSA 1843]